MFSKLDHIELGLEQWLRDFGLALLQMTLGVVSVWFGALKLLGHDPTQAVERVAFYDVKLHPFIVGLGVWEMLIGIALLMPLLSISVRLEHACVRLLLILLLVEIGVTLGLMIVGTHRFFVPSLPYLSVVGEYLVRNLVFAVAALVVAGNVRVSEKAVPQS